MIYLKLQPYRHRSLAVRINEKLSPMFYGPFEVLDKIGTVAYRLKLPPTARLHDVFHVSQLKKSIAGTVAADTIPEMLTSELELQVEAETVMKWRRLTDGSLQVLIKWCNLSDIDSTWEEAEVIKKQFPSFNLEDKVQLCGAGIDGPDKHWAYYKMRPKRVK